MLTGREVELSIIMPCLNESASLGKCIDFAQEFLKNNKLSGEIIVVDNGSTDGSRKIAESRGVYLVEEKVTGYGNACRKGLRVAKGDILILIDADGSYQIDDVIRLIEMLEEGYDLVIGSRLRGNIASHAMPWLHRYFGVPILTWWLNSISGLNLSDAHSGLRAIKAAALSKITLSSQGMEFASEILLEAAKRNLSVREVPISYKKRIGQSKLRTFQDGWRHLITLWTYQAKEKIKTSSSLE